MNIILVFGMINIFGNVFIGLMCMWVSMDFNGYVSFCSIGSFWEVEDYIVIINEGSLIFSLWEEIMVFLVKVFFNLVWERFYVKFLGVIDDFVGLFFLNV